MAPAPKGATVAVTSVEFRSLDESIRDCVESLLTVAGIQPKVKAGFAARK